jgi:hypothetical protein
MAGHHHRDQLRAALVGFRPEEPSLYRPADLQIRSVGPDRAEPPITETGYKSHFVDFARVEAAGGPVVYAIAWLDTVAAAPWWRPRQVEGRQLSLF